jgi:hypothetical protein
MPSEEEKKLLLEEVYMDDLRVYDSEVYSLRYFDTKLVLRRLGLFFGLFCLKACKAYCSAAIKVYWRSCSLAALILWIYWTLLSFWSNFCI